MAGTSYRHSGARGGADDPLDCVSTHALALRKAIAHEEDRSLALELAFQREHAGHVEAQGRLARLQGELEGGRQQTNEYLAKIDEARKHILDMREECSEHEGKRVAMAEALAKQKERNSALTTENEARAARFGEHLAQLQAHAASLREAGTATAGP